MAIVAADWSVDRQTGNIRYIGDDHGGTSPSYATVIQLHRWLQDLADNPTSSGDVELDVTDVNPSSRATDNLITLLGNYNIDDASSEHLYDGSIIQGTGGTEVYYDGIVNYGNASVQIQVIQNGAVLAVWGARRRAQLLLCVCAVVYRSPAPATQALLHHRF